MPQRRRWSTASFPATRLSPRAAAGFSAVLMRQRCLNRCNLSDNSAASGAGIGCAYYYAPSGGDADPVTITNCTISGNKATQSGGGVCGNGPNEVTLQNSTISGNTAATGGGIFWDGYGTNDLTLTDCTISANTATQTGGGIYISSGNSSPYGGTLSDATLNSSTIAGNTAVKGGGIFNAGSLSSSTIPSSPPMPARRPTATSPAPPYPLPSIT